MRKKKRAHSPDAFANNILQAAIQEVTCVKEHRMPHTDTGVNNNHPVDMQSTSNFIVLLYASNDIDVFDTRGNLCAFYHEQAMRQKFFNEEHFQHRMAVHEDRLLSFRRGYHSVAIFDLQEIDTTLPPRQVMPAYYIRQIDDLIRRGMMFTAYDASHALSTFLSATGLPDSNIIKLTPFPTLRKVAITESNSPIVIESTSNMKRMKLIPAKRMFAALWSGDHEYSVHLYTLEGAELHKIAIDNALAPISSFKLCVHPSIGKDIDITFLGRDKSRTAAELNMQTMVQMSSTGMLDNNRITVASENAIVSPTHLSPDGHIWVVKRNDSNYEVYNNGHRLPQIIRRVGHQERLDLELIMSINPGNQMFLFTNHELCQTSLVPWTDRINYAFHPRLRKTVFVLMCVKHVYKDRLELPQLPIELWLSICEFIAEEFYFNLLPLLNFW
jgi:hypothetical protein